MLEAQRILPDGKGSIAAVGGDRQCAAAAGQRDVARSVDGNRSIGEAVNRIDAVDRGDDLTVGKIEAFGDARA